MVNQNDYSALTLWFWKTACTASNISGSDKQIQKVRVYNVAEYTVCHLSTIGWASYQEQSESKKGKFLVQNTSRKTNGGSTFFHF